MKRFLIILVMVLWCSVGFSKEIKVLSKFTNSTQIVISFPNYEDYLIRLGSGTNETRNILPSLATGHCSKFDKHTYLFAKYKSTSYGNLIEDYKAIGFDFKTRFFCAKNSNEAHELFRAQISNKKFKTWLIKYSKKYSYS
jgi:hypothetical protein